MAEGEGRVLHVQVLAQQAHVLADDAAHRGLAPRDALYQVYDLRQCNLAYLPTYPPSQMPVMVELPSLILQRSAGVNSSR